jgi:hypothetical protein
LLATVTILSSTSTGIWQTWPRLAQVVADLEPRPALCIEGHNPLQEVLDLTPIVVLPVFPRLDAVVRLMGTTV